MMFQNVLKQTAVNVLSQVTRQLSNRGEPQLRRRIQELYKTQEMEREKKVSGCVFLARKLPLEAVKKIDRNISKPILPSLYDKKWMELAPVLAPYVDATFKAMRKSVY